ncbi:MAG: sigma-70 family RNA polymerase sigma factor [Muribaculaceae bacterium]|nr:sigma-70 family RNA polymerase sigma factor [Muribaculaceae bacterium]
MDSVSKQDRFLQLVDACKPLISKVCYMYAVDSHHFKDLYQETLINIWQGIDAFRGQASASSWIYRITVNTCVSCYRRNKVLSHSVPIDSLESPALICDDDRLAQLNEMYRLVGCLDPVDKAIVLLWLDEKPYDEIASIMGLSRNNVASKLRRIKERLVRMSSE